MRGESGVVDEGRVVGAPKCHSWGNVYHAINEYQLRLNIQRFLWPVYLRGSFNYFASWGVIIPCQHAFFDPLRGAIIVYFIDLALCTH